MVDLAADSEHLYALLEQPQGAAELHGFNGTDWSHLPHELLARISTRIINEVTGVNRVVYDISSKPPATIEWE